MIHQHSQKLPLLPLQAEAPPYEAHDDAEDDLFYTTPSLLDKRLWHSAPWARRLGDLAEKSSTGLVPLLVGLPIVVSIIAHIYFHMFSTLHVFLALVWIGLPAATISTFAAIASRYYTHSATRRDHLKAALLLSLLCTVTWRTFTVSPRRGLSDFTSAPNSNETVFIAVNLYNSEHLFPSFSESLFQLVHHLGEENVYISIYESNSKDHTKYHLSLLQHDLDLRGIQNRIRMLDNNRREDLERIERLAIIRNEALSPIQDAIYGLHDRTFSKVIWLNDIFFRPESVLELLSTNQGRFDQVCALDYLPLGFYDTWVMRDVEGNRPTPLWPYFKREQDISSLRKGDAIPVNSCWNGMTAFDAKWFLPASEDDDNAITTPGVDDGPIRFRTHPECLVSECLLPSYDIHVRSKQRPLIFVNPKAVATYQFSDYLMYDWIMRSNIVNLWSRIWQDLISHSLFGFFAELGRKEDNCADALRSGWKTL
ncbi:related to CAP59 (required for capsule formation) [Ustilago trichophora]|uniref:Related to CAP59 (Required for capsule formation) n=1 Tax=Ustilago trichophora TaxID=86804 RepID=A0A5C3EA80_9BASI|nr:related to CAP59 (required for capsule formation) [Ustilago trichophora]